MVSSLSLEVCKPSCEHLGLGRPREGLCIRGWLPGLLQAPGDGGAPGDNAPSHPQSQVQGFLHFFCGNLNGGRKTQNCKLKAALLLDIDCSVRGPEPQIQPEASWILTKAAPLERG